MKRKLHTAMAIEPLASTWGITRKQADSVHIQLVTDTLAEARNVYSDKITGKLIGFARVSYVEEDTAAIRSFLQRSVNILQEMGYCDNLSAVGARLSYINGTRKERHDSRRNRPVTEVIEVEINNEGDTNQ